MKTLIKIVILASSVLFTQSCATYTPTYSYGPYPAVSLDVFYSSLSPYGMWMQYPRYGYVWVPRVTGGFTPYATAGHWIYTDYGWTWYSAYDWGWAPFHYGRWFYDNAYGWVWVPDTTWGPAWVVWSEGGGYCGWAPLSPGISVDYAVSGRLRVPRENWVFVPEGDLLRRHIERYRVSPSRNIKLLNNAQLVSRVGNDRHTVYLKGPERSRIERKTGKPIREVPVVENSRPGNGQLHSNRYELYKPDVRRNPAHSRPAKIFERDDVRQIQQRRGNLERHMEPHRRGNMQRTPPGHQKRQHGKDNRGNGYGRKKGNN